MDWQNDGVEATISSSIGLSPNDQQFMADETPAAKRIAAMAHEGAI
jgi:hypothetical protein